MPSMCDATCPKCKKRFGWAGDSLQRPPCPRCGHQVSQEALQHDATEMENFRQLLAERPNSQKGKALRTRMRHAAGLSLGQAAKMLRLPLDVLEAIERQDADPLPELEARMTKVYDLD